MEGFPRVGVKAAVIKLVDETGIGKYVLNGLLAKVWGIGITGLGFTKGTVECTTLPVGVVWIGWKFCLKTNGSIPAGGGGKDGIWGGGGMTVDIDICVFSISFIKVFSSVKIKKMHIRPGVHKL